MAINKQIDSGALIAEAIDYYYKSEADYERIRLRCEERRAYYEWIVARLNLIQEAAGDFNKHYSEDDPYRDMDDDRQGHNQWVRNFGVASAEGIQPYRTGYKTGWRAGHEGRSNNPPEGKAGNQHYMDGYNAGFKKAGYAKELLNHHDKGDWDKADEIAAKRFVGPSTKYHFPMGNDEDKAEIWNRWAGVKLDPQRLGVQDGHGLALDHTVKAINAINKSLNIKDEHGMEGMNYSKDKPHVEGKHHVNKAPHPADIGGYLAGKFQARASAQREAMKGNVHVGDKVQPWGNINPNFDIDDVVAGNVGPSGRSDIQVSKEKEEEEEKRIKKQKREEFKKNKHKELIDIAFHEDDVEAHRRDKNDPNHKIHDGIKEFEDAGYLEEDGDYKDIYEEMVTHAHDLWRKRAIKKILDSQKEQQESYQKHGVRVKDAKHSHPLLLKQYPIVSDKKNATGHSMPHDSINNSLDSNLDNDYRKAKFDPAAALIHSLNSEGGFRKHGWRVAAANDQPGFENFRAGRAARDDNDHLKGSTLHPANGAINGALSRALVWFHDDNKGGFGLEHDMWDYHHGLTSEAKANYETRLGKAEKNQDQELINRTMARKAEENPYLKSRWMSVGKSKDKKLQISLKGQQMSNIAKNQRINRTRRSKYAPVMFKNFANEAIDIAMLSFEEWVSNNVRVSTEGVKIIMSEIYSKIEANYGILFESFNNVEEIK